MFNVGSAELLVILLVALVILGPAKLPEAARQVGKTVSQLKRMSQGFQAELRDALKEPIDSSPPSYATDGGQAVIVNPVPAIEAGVNATGDDEADAVDKSEATAADPSSSFPPSVEPLAPEGAHGHNGDSIR